MEGLSPIYDWLNQPPVGWLDEFQSTPMHEWRYDGGGPPSNNAPNTDGADANTHPPAVDAQEIHQHISQQQLLQMSPYVNAEAGTLQLAATFGEADVQGQTLDCTWDVDNRVSDWLLASRPGGEPLITAAESTCVQSLSLELERLKAEIFHLQESLNMAHRMLEEDKRQENQVTTLQQRLDALWKWAVETSAEMNDSALKRDGLSPLQRHFGIVLGPRMKRRQ